jgi:hypothetical protein
VNKKSKKRQAKGCQHWFGYLGREEKVRPILKECEECKKAVECMLEKLYSPKVIAEIKKYY